MNDHPPTINLIVLRAASPKTLAQFYESLGCKFERERHGNGPEHFSANLGGLVLEIYPRKDDDPGTSSLRLGLVVSDLDAVLATATGAKILRSPTLTYWGYQAVLEDSEGHKIELTQRVI